MRMKYMEELGKGGCEEVLRWDRMRRTKEGTGGLEGRKWEERRKYREVEKLG